jgi:RNA polymerase sigma-70 factor (ECF subfamily)
MTSQQEITELLIDWNRGESDALDRLLPLVEAELRRIAGRHMRREGPGHTLQTTALVHEAYLKLVDQRRVRWQNRAHFFALAAQIMRRILLDHARARARAKRGGGAVHVDIAEAAVVTPEKSEDLLALDEALERLSEFDPVKGRIVEMRHFGGLSVDEVAEVLSLAPVTVMRHWSLAKAWLKRELRRGAHGD